MKATADMYTYRVFWSGEDGAFVASVSEFPSLSNVADSQKEALNGLSELVADVLADMRESGEQPPVPLGCRTYSGKYALRMTPEQHRRVVTEAAEQGVFWISSPVNFVRVSKRSFLTACGFFAVR